MNMQSQLRLIRQRWWVVLLSVIVASGLAGLVTIRTVPQYASTMTFFVITPNQQGISGAYQGSIFLEQRNKSYANLLTSDALAQKVVAADGGLGLTAAEVQARISAKPRADTVLLDTVVTDTDQARSLTLADTVAEQFVKLVQSIETPPGQKDPLVKIEVVNGPRVTAGPISPQPVRNLTLGVLLGLMLGAAIAVFAGATDSTVRDGVTLARIADAPLLAQIPYDRAIRTSRLITGVSARSPRAEATRALRTNLRFVDLAEPARVIAVSSALQAEGKSTTACNLAIALVEAGWRVLLIDADLRRPQIADYLDLDGRVGLTNVLLGEVDLTEAIQPWRDTSLMVLPAGAIPPNPSELLGSKPMADLLDAARDLADIVVIDTTPLLSVTDAVVVAVQTEGTLLVTRQGRTALPQVTAAVEALRQVEARLLGCVLNMAKLDRRAVAEYRAYLAAGPESRSRHSRAAQPATPTQAASVEAEALPMADAAPPSDATAEISRIPR